MKKSFILILALLAGVLMRFGETKGLAAWTASSGSFDTSEYLEAYEPVLDSYRAYLNGYEPGDAIATSDGGYYLELGKTGISELCLDGGDICYEQKRGFGAPETHDRKRAWNPDCADLLRRLQIKDLDERLRCCFPWNLAQNR